MIGAGAIRFGFAAGLNDLLIVTAVLAFAGAVCALLLIRSRAQFPASRACAPAARGRLAAHPPPRRPARTG
jgi:hypothetical protein